MKSSPPQGAPPPPGRGRPAIAPPEPFNQFTLRRGTGASCGAVRHYAPNLAGAPRLRRTKVPPVWHDRRAPDTLSPVIHAAPPRPGTRASSSATMLQQLNSTTSPRASRRQAPSQGTGVAILAHTRPCEGPPGHRATGPPGHRLLKALGRRRSAEFESQNWASRHESTSLQWCLPSPGPTEQALPGLWRSTLHSLKFAEVLRCDMRHG